MGDDRGARPSGASGSRMVFAAQPSRDAPGQVEVVITETVAGEPVPGSQPERFPLTLAEAVDLAMQLATARQVALGVPCPQRTHANLVQLRPFLLRDGHCPFCGAFLQGATA